MSIHKSLAAKHHKEAEDYKRRIAENPSHPRAKEFEAAMKHHTAHANKHEAKGRARARARAR